jgi:hypothetical protein
MRSGPQKHKKGATYFKYRQIKSNLRAFRQLGGKIMENKKLEDFGAH